MALPKFGHELEDHVTDRDRRDRDQCHTIPLGSCSRKLTNKLLPQTPQLTSRPVSSKDGLVEEHPCIVKTYQQPELGHVD